LPETTLDITGNGIAHILFALHFQIQAGLEWWNMKKGIGVALKLHTYAFFLHIGLVKLYIKILYSLMMIEDDSWKEFHHQCPQIL